MPSSNNNNNKSGVDTLLKSYCGVYLDTYIAEFIKKNSYIDLHKLWKNRQFRILLSPTSPIWHVGRIIKVEHETSTITPGLIYWNLTMEFVTTQTASNDNDGGDVDDEFSLGDYVELNHLKKASMYNGRYGVIVSNNDFQKTSRYGVEVRDLSQLYHRPGYDPIKTKQIAVQSKNLSKFITLKNSSKKNNDGIRVLPRSQWTWRIHRMNPATGGTLEGKDQDCSHLISLEWLDKDDNSDINVDCCSKEQISLGPSWFGTSGYLLNLQGNDIVSVRTKDNPVTILDDDANCIDVWKFARIGGASKDNNSIYKKCPIDSFPRCDLNSIMPSKRFTINGGKYEVKNKWAVDIFNRVVTEGNFVIEWNESSDQRKIYNGMNRLTVRYFTDETGSEAPPIRNPYILASAYFGTQNIADGYFDVGMGRDLELKYPKAFGGIPFIGLLNNNQYQYVIIRLTHWFLRNHRELQSVLKEPDGIICLLQGIVDSYRNLGARKEALDAAILKADFVHAKNKLTSTAHEVQGGIVGDCDQVGGILEALGRFRDAAMIYSEMGDKLTKDLSLKFKLYSKAGHQYRIISEYENTEKCFVKGLFCVRDNKNLRLDAIEQIMCNFGESSQCNEDEQSSQEFYMMCTLAALLYVSGVKRLQKMESIMKTCGENNSEFLKVKYLTPSSAKKALRMACSVSNAKEFRKIILNCKKLGQLPEVLLFHGKKPTKSSTKKIAKEYFTKDTDQRNACNGCDKMVENLKECPCRMAYYCSRKCQISHFPIHKKFCPIQKNKTKR